MHTAVQALSSLLLCSCGNDLTLHQARNVGDGSELGTACKVASANIYDIKLRYKTTINPRKFDVQSLVL